MADSPPASPAPSPIDRSDIIAVIALVISVLSTIIGLRETRILGEQQQLMLEEKAASVWPYLDGGSAYELRNDTLLYSYRVTNKGVGPAVVGGHGYRFDDRPTELMTALTALGRELPGYQLLPTNLTTNFSAILSPGESVEVFGFRVTGGDNPLQLLRRLIDRLEVELCYCSIYGQCWELVPDERPRGTADCAARLDH